MFRTMRMSVKRSLRVAGMPLLTGLVGFSGLYNISRSTDRLDVSLDSMSQSEPLTDGLRAAAGNF